MELTAKLSLEDIQDAENIVTLLKNDDLRKIGSRVVESYDIDKASRKKWETRMQDSMELALQITQSKTLP